LFQAAAPRETRWSRTQTGSVSWERVRVPFLAALLCSTQLKEVGIIPCLVVRGIYPRAPPYPGKILVSLMSKDQVFRLKNFRSGAKWTGVSRKIRLSLLVLSGKIPKCADRPQVFHRNWIPAAKISSRKVRLWALRELLMLNYL